MEKFHVIFSSKYDIRDNKGELYPLTSHQFRATFVNTAQG